MNYALILSGGSGTRLWPLSRRARPKHLISLAGEVPLLEQTLDRLGEIIPPEQRFLITIPEQAPIVRDLARGRAAGIIIEPLGRNNLFPMALSTRFLFDRDPDARIAFLPSDHHILKPGNLLSALECAFDVAGEGYVVTLGIHTRHPEPNYGHIMRGDKIEGFESSGLEVCSVNTFREKPPMDLAEEYHSSDDWFWNGGIFIFSASAMLGLIEEIQPELFDMINELAPILSKEDPGLDHPVIDWEAVEEINEAYRTLPRKLQTSIDYALIEKCSKVATIPVEMGWNDLGGFAALSNLLEPDDSANSVGPGPDESETRVLMPGTAGTTVFPGRRCVVCLDCEDMIVVDTPDALLVLPRSSSGKVREVVDLIRQQGWLELL